VAGRVSVHLPMATVDDICECRRREAIAVNMDSSSFESFRRHRFRSIKTPTAVRSGFCCDLRARNAVRISQNAAKTLARQLAICVHRRPRAVNMTLPAFATGRSAANPPHAAAAVDRQDRRTLDRFKDSVPHTIQGVKIWNKTDTEMKQKPK